MTERVTGRLIEVSPDLLRVDDGEKLWRFAVRCSVSLFRPADFVELLVSPS